MHGLKATANPPTHRSQAPHLCQDLVPPKTCRTTTPLFLENPILALFCLDLQNVRPQREQPVILESEWALPPKCTQSVARNTTSKGLALWNLSANYCQQEAESGRGGGRSGKGPQVPSCLCGYSVISAGTREQEHRVQTQTPPTHLCRREAAHSQAPAEAPLGPPRPRAVLEISGAQSTNLLGEYPDGYSHFLSRYLEPNLQQHLHRGASLSVIVTTPPGGRCECPVLYMGKLRLWPYLEWPH